MLNTDRRFFKELRWTSRGAVKDAVGPLKAHSESFDALRTNGDQFEIVEINPFMLSLSKHAPPFLSSLL